MGSLQVSPPVGALRVTTGQSHEADGDVALLPFTEPHNGLCLELMGVEGEVGNGGVVLSPSLLPRLGR